HCYQNRNPEKSSGTNYGHIFGSMVLSSIQRALEMNQPTQTREHTMAYRSAVRMFESAFAACERVTEVDRQLLFSVLSSIQRVFEMNQHKQPPEYTVDYRVAVRMFESAFAACER